LIFIKKLPTWIFKFILGCNKVVINIFHSSWLFYGNGFWKRLALHSGGNRLLGDHHGSPLIYKSLYFPYNIWLNLRFLWLYKRHCFGLAFIDYLLFAYKHGIE
jgi:hypothetical protein